jgi:hypothetical protein
MPSNPIGTPPKRQPGTTPVRTPAPLGPPPVFSPKGKPPAPPMSATPPPTPVRGGIHPVHGIFLVGNPVKDDWSSAGRYRYTLQRRGDKHVTKVEQNIVNDRDSISILKFHGTLKVDATAVNELDKDQFVRSIQHTVREHGQQPLYAIMNGTVVTDLLANHHLFTVDNVLTSIEERETATDASKFDTYEEDKFGLSRHVVESKLSKPTREKIHIHYDHLVNFYDLPGPAIFAMAVEICNSSQSFDIEGAQEKFGGLNLEDFPGEDVTACSAVAQKHAKVLQSGYATHYRTGSNLLSKFTKSSCEEFNWKAFTKLDLVKKMESTYKLYDPKLITANIDYPELGPIVIVAWVQREHIKLVTDHDWPDLAAKLPESNLAGTEINMSSTYANKVIEGKEERKCYRCGSADHLRPDCPDPPKEGEHKGGNRVKQEDQWVRKMLASWKYIQPADLTKTYLDEAKRPWKFCTKCTCRATGTKWFFQLSHLDADHKENFRPEANLSLANDTSAGIPSGPPLVTTTEPDEKEDDDED